MVIVSAPPGAGKTTRVPLALLETPWSSNGRVLMLEPRRLAARRAAEFMSSQLGEDVGKIIGYRVRGDVRVSPRTHVEVLTEGILTRMLQSDPDLPGVAAVIFDEFHERSIHADLGLALALDAQQHVRPDLRILIMSATLDGIGLSRVLDQAPIVESAGRPFPVETRYARFKSDKSIEHRTVETIQRALQNEEGDLLVFLPGRREIRTVEHLLWEKGLPENVSVHTLHGEDRYDVQAAALRPAPTGKRKVILSTNVAETSVTIDGVRVVIDSGLARTIRFDPRRGMSGLITVAISKASAEQRRGRAGREAQGVCYRLWTEEEHAHRPEFSLPEIKSADLTPLALELELWGSPMGEGLRFVDPPPPAHLQQARSVLTLLGALDDAGRLTPLGKEIARLPVHPRLAAMLLRANEMKLGSLACDVAALLEERDLFAGKRDVDVDLASRWEDLYHGRSDLHDRIRTQARRLREILNVRESEGDQQKLGLLLALGYPDRVARRRGSEAHSYQMVSGTLASLPTASRLRTHEFLAIGDAEEVGAEVRIYLAAPLGRDNIHSLFPHLIRTEEIVEWNSKEGVVIARRATKIGAVTLSEQALDVSDERIAHAMLRGIREGGLEALTWTKETRSFQQRSEWLRQSRLVEDAWPLLSDDVLVQTMDNWLLPFLSGIWKREQLARLDLKTILESIFSSEQLQLLQRLAPSHLRLPSGSRVALEYSPGSAPILAVQLQELFGQRATPRIGEGRVPVVIHLLSPARRPLAVTQDLESFWRNVYPEIRRQMRAQYPKHYWPEDPLNAQPTNKTVRRKY